MNESPPQVSATNASEHDLAGLVDKAIAARLAGYKKVAYAFAAGFASILTVVIGSGLITKGEVFRMLHDHIFGFETSLTKALDGSVAVSYSNNFWLALGEQYDPQQAVTFYSDSSQGVRAMVRIEHQGVGNPLEVDIRLEGAEQEVWSGTTDLPDTEFDISTAIQRDEPHSLIISHHENVHVLVFSIVDKGEPTDDHVFVRALINVSGRDRGQP